jgi:hypothetical protein
MELYVMQLEQFTGIAGHQLRIAPSTDRTKARLKVLGACGTDDCQLGRKQPMGMQRT